MSAKAEYFAGLGAVAVLTMVVFGAAAHPFVTLRELVLPGVVAVCASFLAGALLWVRVRRRMADTRALWPLGLLIAVITHVVFGILLAALGWMNAIFFGMSLTPESSWPGFLRFLKASYLAGFYSLMGAPFSFPGALLVVELVGRRHREGAGCA